MEDAEITRALKKLWASTKRRSLDDWETQFVRDHLGGFKMSPKERESALKIIAACEADPETSKRARAEEWEAAEACGQCCDGWALMDVESSSGMLREERHEQQREKLARMVGSRQQTAYSCTCARGKLRRQWQSVPSILSAPIASRARKVG